MIKHFYTLELHYYKKFIFKQLISLIKDDFDFLLYLM